jgi:hypothetical protein
MTDKDRIAALEREVAELKGKVDPPKSTFVPMTDEEHRDWVYQMQERRMSMATPPSVIRDWAVIPEEIVKGIRQDRHAPTSATGMIPQSRPSGDVRETGGKSSTPGWVDPTPLSPPPGIEWVDAQLIADEVRQRAELKRKLGE